ncbi:hypothetical protein [Rhodospirillaceae bacterium SYSU D60014]|uniref:hypothetical protein n=1 Tax=Virgifigura deserti TaxID=2268457 RepID=UPI000E66CACF
MRLFDFRRIVGLIALVALLSALPIQASMSLLMGGDAMAALDGDAEGSGSPMSSSCDGCGDLQKAVAGMDCAAFCAAGFAALPAATLGLDAAGRAISSGMPPRAGIGIPIAPEPLPPRPVSLT